MRHGKAQEDPGNRRVIVLITGKASIMPGALSLVTTTIAKTGFYGFAKLDAMVSARGAWRTRTKKERKTGISTWSPIHDMSAVSMPFA